MEPNLRAANARYLPASSAGRQKIHPLELFQGRRDTRARNEQLSCRPQRKVRPYCRNAGRSPFRDPQLRRNVAHARRMITLLSKVIHRRLDDASPLGFRARTRQCRTSEAESSGRASSNPAHNSDLKSGENDIEKHDEYQFNFIELYSNVSLPISHSMTIGHTAA